MPQPVVVTCSFTCSRTKLDLSVLILTMSSVFLYRQDLRTVLLLSKDKNKQESEDNIKPDSHTAIQESG
jgi:hypothetical protein